MCSLPRFLSVSSLRGWPEQPRQVSTPNPASPHCMGYKCNLQCTLSDLRGICQYFYCLKCTPIIFFFFIWLNITAKIYFWAPEQLLAPEHSTDTQLCGAGLLQSWGGEGRAVLGANNTFMPLILVSQYRYNTLSSKYILSFSYRFVNSQNILFPKYKN